VAVGLNVPGPFVRFAGGTTCASDMTYIESFNVWSTVRVPGCAGSLAQAAAPQHPIAGTHIDDDDHVRG
jgi:hypothetical protein